MSTTRTIRHINRSRVLGALFRGGGMSRAHLARDLGLSLSVVGAVIGELMQDGFVRDDRSDNSEDRPGRPGRRVDLNPGHSLFIGVDIAVGRLSLAVLDTQAEMVLHRAEAVVPARVAPEVAVDRVAALVRRTIDDLPAGSAVRGLCVSVPGLLDRDGVLMRAPLLGWSFVPISAMVRASLGWSGVLCFENDANAFAFAEIYRDRSDLCEDALVVFIDAGVGGGLIIDRRIVRGARGFAGEIGHICIGDHGFAAVTDLPGSLESYVGRQAVMTRFRHYGGVADTLEEVLLAVAAREPAARSMLADWASWLGRGLASLTAVLDPGKIILAGPVAALFPHARLEVLQALRRNLMPQKTLPTVSVSTLPGDAAAVGAACILHHDLLGFDVPPA